MRLPHFGLDLNQPVQTQLEVGGQVNLQRMPGLQGEKNDRPEFGPERKTILPQSKCN